VPHAKITRYAGHTYLNAGWALGDVLLIEPKASDQRVAELLNVTPQTVQYWRVKSGIPPYKQRSARSPYLKESKSSDEDQPIM
jgi:hypothetical protein